jgi:nucleotide-binding universal stress UspA family protein
LSLMNGGVFGIQAVVDHGGMAQSAGRVPVSRPVWHPRGRHSPGTKGAVVAALNGSAADGPVVDWAVDSAARLGASLRLVTIVDADSQPTPSRGLHEGAWVEGDVCCDPGYQVLAPASDRARSRRDLDDVATAVLWGSPQAALVRLSERAAQMVVGAPGRGRLGRTRLGSVAFPVVAEACCPVVVVPADTVVTPLRHLVVGVDGSKASVRAVEMALQVAKDAKGARVTCVLGWNLGGVGGSVITEPSTEPWTAVERRLAALGHRTVGPVTARYPGIRMNIVTRYGSPARAVVDAATDVDADLVVVGSRGLGGLRGRLLGSVSRQIVERAEHAILVVH